MFTNDEISHLIALLDVSVKSAGINVFQNDGGLHLHEILKKLQKNLDDNEAPKDAA